MENLNNTDKTSENTEKELRISDVMLSLSDTMKFIDWVSDKAYKRCINGEWIQTGTGDYKTVARNTIELYNLYKDNGA